MDKTLLNIPTYYVFSCFCCLKKKNMKITKFPSDDILHFAT